MGLLISNVGADKSSLGAVRLVRFIKAFRVVRILSLLRTQRLVDMVHRCNALQKGSKTLQRSLRTDSIQELRSGMLTQSGTKGENRLHFCLQKRALCKLLKEKVAPEKGKSVFRLPFRNPFTNGPRQCCAYPIPNTEIWRKSTSRSQKIREEFSVSESGKSFGQLQVSKGIKTYTYP